jgi:hypothetical protein
MQQEEIILRLLEHSGTPVPLPKLDRNSFADLVRKPRPGTDVQLESAVEDILHCLEYLNDSNKKGIFKATVPTNLAYAISGIMWRGLQSVMQLISDGPRTATDLKAILASIWKINNCWDSFLAGDIENLQDHMRLEASARGIELPAADGRLEGKDGRRDTNGQNYDGAEKE